MVKLNWNIFKAKFDGQETSMFELLAYHLFCDEYDIPNGIFRFKNQTGIETEPIEREGEIIGFQAKFYEAKPSDNKEDIIDSIKKAKSKNPNLNKILFYLNKEFSESSSIDKKDPKYKIEIEKEAKKAQIEIVWKVQSNFEIQLAKTSNSYLSEYFFSNEKTIIDSLIEIDAHTWSILSPIHCDIKYKSEFIKIDRSDIIEEIRSQSKISKSIIISGNGGTGKTALIKELFDINKETPFYIFKANEFLAKHINDLFSPYSLSFTDFLESHKEEKSKLFIIDSAERLSEIENNEPFKEFVASLIKNNWCIIFTTRNNYLDDLRFQLIHVYRLSPNNINIENLLEDDLDKLAQSYGFVIPPDIRLKQLIRNPFYLNQYLTYYSEDSQKVKYSDFKSNLWNIKIKNSSYTKDNLHIERENCFLSLAKDRSESGNFYTKAKSCNSRILSLLQNDEIIEYSSINSGYFITHDIYEEWALELLIEKAYQNNADATLFLNEIGLSLSIRRAFRLWITNKIFNQPNEVEQLIEEVIYSNNTSASWKDEIFISILLSDLSITFFSEIKEILFKDDFRLLRRVIFLLRIACKEVNEPLMKQLKGSKEISPEYIFTKPKGDGWKAIIDLVFEEIDSFRIDDTSFLIPLLKEWNAEFKFGSITKNSTKIALKFYEDIISENDSYSYSDISKELVKIVIQGAKEVTHELKEIFDNVVTNNWSEHNSPYNKLCKYVLTKTHENIPVIAALPNEVMKIADLFWFNSATKDDLFGYDGMDMEQYYSLNENGFDYDPSSALQTPIYWLLLFSPKETFDFIISFTNKSVESFSKSKYGETVELIDIHIDNDTIQKQFISDALWSMYRGTGSPTTPNVLQCIHMALEKYLLEQAKVDESNNLSGWLKYLVRNSKSASITSVVASVVKAYPDKYFEIAEILFKTIDLFFYDMMLLNSEHCTGNSYGLNQQHKIHEDEKMKTLEDSHRNTSLEHTALKYQLFRSENISVEEVEKKQKTIWAIIDNYYQTELSKNEKLLFVRIDSRKMEPKIEQKDDKILIYCNPEIDPELKKYSEEGQAEFSGFMKYSALGVWSRNKFKQRQDIAQYTQYENNPKRVIKEIKELLSPETSKPTHFDFATPAFAGYVLLKEYSKDLSKGELELCRDIIIDFASNPLKEEYAYQIFDGVEVAINAVPLLYDLFPDNILDYNTLLLFILFDEYQLGEYKRVCDYSIESIINSLWKKSSENALKIIYAYLYFKPLLNNFIKALKPDNSTPFRLRKPQALIIKEFLEKHERQLEKFFQIDYENFSVDSIDFTNYEFIELEITLQLIPNDTKNDILTSFVLGILPILSEKVLRHDNESRLFRFRMRFFKKICPFILMRDSQNIKLFTKSFVNNFTSSEEIKDLLEEFIGAENRLERYEQFWLVWEEFYNSIVNNSKGGGGYYEQYVIYSYLLALPSWTKEAKEWHSLKVKDKKFYKKIVSDIGDNVYVLDSIAQILNQIGSNFLNEGIVWLSDMLENNKNLWSDKLGINTIYYLELLIRRYLFINRTKVRRNKNLKERVLIILNFLIEKSSVNAYLLREEIL